MKVYPKESNKGAFAEARQRKYNSKVEDNNRFDARVEDAELAQDDNFMYNKSDGSVFQASIDDFTKPDKVALLRRYYVPVKYRGTIFPINGEQPYTLDSIKCKRENNLEVVEIGNKTVYDRKSHRRKSRPFNLNSALSNHVSMGDNLGIFFYQDRCKMIAFDIDSETGALHQGVKDSTRYMIRVLYSLGLIPFVYYSGSKGFHVEVFFDGYISINKLNTLNNIILNKHIEQGGRHIDCVYPSGKAYKVFGCHHYKTGEFTKALKVEISNDYDIIHWKSKDPAESWDIFSKTPFNDCAFVDKIIADNPDLAKSKPKNQKGNANNDYAPKAHFYDLDILKCIHETGLFPPYTRYNTAFQLGRYFRHKLKITEDDAKKEIGVWLKQHYAEQCPNGLTPFEGAYNGTIKSPYALCEYETLNNCLNGYRVGKPFKRERVEIFNDRAVEYLSSLKYSRKKEAALMTLLSNAQEFKSLSMGFSYEQFLKLFHVNSKSTVSAWLKEFMTDFIFVCTKKGEYKTRKTSQYRLNLPEDCYTAIED